jgi:hypothetical protein
MPSNYVLIRRIELSASTASITFANIPQTGYTDLKVVISSRISDPDAGALVYLRPNGLTTNQVLKRLRANGSTASSASSTAIYLDTDGAYNTANIFGNCEFYIPNYTSSNYKSIIGDGVAENNATESYMTMTGSLWSSTSAITSLTLFPSGSSNFVQYSTFSIYGLAASDTSPTLAPQATGGNIITTDGTYWYHAFLTSGSFTPLGSLSCDILQIAGGGGGSGTANAAGSAPGGGAGGLLGFTSQSLTATSYTCTIGSGGAGGAVNTQGASGSNSQFGSLTASVGGGRGGLAVASGSATAGGSGGSGGGGGYSGNTPAAGGSATSGQGFAGGAGSTFAYSGGGGGAGEAGNTDGQGYGGDGTSAYSSWGAATGTGENVAGTYFYAGGGSGRGNQAGSAGSGGGGLGGSQPNGAGQPGTANTGGGGGGAGDAYPNSPTAAGAAGGSGIIIVRYAV